MWKWRRQWLIYQWIETTTCFADVAFFTSLGRAQYHLVKITVKLDNQSTDQTSKEQVTRRTVAKVNWSFASHFVVGASNSINLCRVPCVYYIFAAMRKTTTGSRKGCKSVTLCWPPLLPLFSLVQVLDRNFFFSGFTLNEMTSRLTLRWVTEATVGLE